MSQRIRDHEVEELLRRARRAIKESEALRHRSAELLEMLKRTLERLGLLDELDSPDRKRKTGT